MGLERGYCQMIGGEDDVVKHLDPIFATLAPGVGTVPRTPGREKIGGTAEQGYLHCGPNGAGHFVKMVHNGIEYGIMAAYAEGLGVLEQANIGKHARTVAPASGTRFTLGSAAKTYTERYWKEREFDTVDAFVKLAREAGTSRSVLTGRFSRFLGRGPIAYLADWRLELAAEALRGTSRSVLQVATDVGYDSEASFNRAFKRRFGDPPARYRTVHRVRRASAG